MREQDYVLALLTVEEIPSRTMLQKLTYLLSQERGDNLAFAAHFYGPYSQSLHDEIESMAAAGLVDERVLALEPWESTSFDVLQYRYRLTDEGHQAAQKLPQDFRGAASHLVASAHGAHAWNASALSMAAKLHHLRQFDSSVGEAEIPTLARQFGWRLTERDARRGAQLLEALVRRD